MLFPTVTLDAAMPVYHALRRLAMHGYWSDPGSREAREWLEEYAARIRAAAQLRATAGGAPRDRARPEGVPLPPVDPAGLTAEEAARRLARPPHTGRVAVRRQDGVTLYWYAFRVEDVLWMLEHAQRDAILRDALNLHETGAAPVEQASTLGPEGVDRFIGVVLHGAEPLGIGEIELLAPPPDPGVTRSGTGGGPGAPPPSASAPGEGFGIAPPSPAPVEVHAYPLLEAPTQVVVGERFDLAIGLADAPVPGLLSSGRMAFPVPSGATVLRVEVQLVAEGFEAPEGWSRTLPVRVARPAETRVTIPLIPLPQDDPVRLTSLLVHYSLDGVSRGSAARYLVVERTPGEAPPPDDRGLYWLDAEPPPPDLTLAPAPGRPDLEVDIAKPDGNPAKGSYRCIFRNAHGVPVPDGPLPIELGDDAQTFAKKLIDEVRQWSGEEIVDNLLENLGAVVADKLPSEFWSVLREVAVRVEDRPVMLQLNSAEPYVPWELALVDPPLDPARPPYLAAQVAMGRWILGDAAVAAPPRDEVKVKAMGVMAGMYNVATGLRPLPKAQEEAGELLTTYASMPAIELEATAADLKSLLDANLTYRYQPIGGVQAVHFAGHGEVDPTRPQDAALYLSNGKPLTPIFFRRSALGKTCAPFVFLNACMVGTAGEMLGDYGGFPGNCLAGGFSGLVAPLWAVNDEVAKSIALDFYKQVLDSGGRTVAEVLREMRSKYRSSQPVPSYLAYVYYGNPYLTLTRADAPPVPEAPTVTAPAAPGN
jgi:hypothetical protein